MTKLSRRFPAEWEQQDGVLLCFPHNGSDWPGKYKAIQWALVEFIRKVSSYEKVFLVVADDTLKKRVEEMLGKAHIDLSQVQFILCKTNRSWMRDSGPIIVRCSDGSREAINFNFNGWAKYKNYHLDRNVPHAVSSSLGLNLTQAIYKGQPVVLEGGAIDVNGAGCLITSEECLMHPQIQVRNKGFTKEDYEHIFEMYLGIESVIWMGDGISGDDTHGHIDDLCRFVNPHTIVTVIERDTKDDNYKVLSDNRMRLQNASLQNGRRPDIIELPMPSKIMFEGIRLPASYANFLIINGAVLVPTFNDVNDRVALSILSECFPNRDIIGISAIDLIWGFGTLHCLSQQIPARIIS